MLFGSDGMKKYKRIFTIVLDSLGIGEMNDSSEYGDVGVNTLGHIAEHTKDFQIPNLKKLGIYDNRQNKMAVFFSYDRIEHAPGGDGFVLYKADKDPVLYLSA